jgi:hypothetical protein
MHYPAVWCGSEDTLVVSWCRRGSTSTTKVNAHLLRWLAQLSQQHTFTLKPVNVTGKTNHIADFCSRSFHLSDQDFRLQLQSTFPIKPSWHIVQPSKENVSGMISALSCKMSPWELQPTKPSQAQTTWKIWEQFCATINADPTLTASDDPVTNLQLFAHHYHRGDISPSKAKVCSKTVGDALRAIGQTLSNLGYANPRLQPSGKLTFRLQRLLSYYNKQDLPPDRVKPIPIQLLQTTCNTLRLASHPRSDTLADMLTLGFFFLLRPGEYAHTTNPESAPFRLVDVHLHRDNIRINHLLAPLHILSTAMFVCLEFTTQKNGVRGELIGMGRSGHPSFCPAQACINRITHLRQHSALPYTPLYSYFVTNWFGVSTTTLTTELRLAVTALGAEVGLTPTDVSIRSLCASGAMALLCAQVDPNQIRLLGRWRSDKMLRLLYILASCNKSLCNN